MVFRFWLVLASVWHGAICAILFPSEHAFVCWSLYELMITAVQFSALQSLSHTCAHVRVHMCIHQQIVYVNIIIMCTCTCRHVQVPE